MQWKVLILAVILQFQSSFYIKALAVCNTTNITCRPVLTEIPTKHLIPLTIKVTRCVGGYRENKVDYICRPIKKTNVKRIVNNCGKTPKKIIIQQHDECKMTRRCPKIKKWDNTANKCVPIKKCTTETRLNSKGRCVLVRPTQPRI